MSLLQEMEKFGLADCEFNRHLDSVVVYHRKSELRGWHEVFRAPIDSQCWNNADRGAINHLLEHGEQVLTLGWDMWELKHKE